MIFIAGVYGVGKSTICDLLSKELKIPHYSASDLITNKNGEKYGVNKYVSDVIKNQESLLDAISEVLCIHRTIILSGHFCIINKKDEAEPLPLFVFEKMDIDKIILLEADITMILKNLQIRDNKKYDEDTIDKLIDEERNIAVKVCEKFQKKLYKHTMTFNNDISIILQEVGI